MMPGVLWSRSAATTAIPIRKAGFGSVTMGGDHFSGFSIQLQEGQPPSPLGVASDTHSAILAVSQICQRQPIWLKRVSGDPII